MSGSSTNRPRARQRVVQAAAALLLAVVLTACSDPMTLTNYKQLQGSDKLDTLEKVEAVFGAGTRIGGVDGQFSAGGMGLEKYEWKRGDKVLWVTFKDGRLYKRAKSGEWGE